MTFDLQNNSYRPYRKPDNLPVYIHKHSNHPSVIPNELPESIAKRISDLPSRENIFHDAIPVYKEALLKTGFTSDLFYTHKQTDCTHKQTIIMKKTKSEDVRLYGSIPDFPGMLKVILVNHPLI